MSAANPTTAGHGYSEAYLLLPYDPSQAMKPPPQPTNIVTSVAGVPDSISYAGPPTSNPPLLQSIVVDSNGVQWQFFNNQWN